jgi:hypothetical protein
LFIFSRLGQVSPASSVNNAELHMARSPPVEINKGQSSKAAAEEFFPKGAIAFFAAMLGAFALIWLGMYVLLVHRQLGI